MGHLTETMAFILWKKLACKLTTDQKHKLLNITILSPKPCSYFLLGSMKKGETIKFVLVSLAIEVTKGL